MHPAADQCAHHTADEATDCSGDRHERLRGLDVVLRVGSAG
jgi:hypothetical protein